MMRGSQSHILFWTLMLVLSSCHKDTQTQLPGSKGVYVLNEGNFNFGNGEVSFYNPGNNEATNGLFHAANGYFLGDVVQSMYIRDSIGFIVVNNSSKIEVVKLPSLLHIRTITIPAASPRYFLALNDSMAYVTELYAKKIWLINYLSGVVTGSLTTGGWTEEMLPMGSDVFVAQKINTTQGGTFATLLKVNAITNTGQHNTTFGGRDVNGIAKDKLDHIWVAVDEDTAHGLHAGFYCYDKMLVEQKSFFFSDFGHHPSRLCINPEGDRLYFEEKGIYSFWINDNTVPNAATITTTGKNVYGLAIDPVTGDIYFSDALDYVQPSQIYRYDKNGNLLYSFTAGINSGNFAFNE